jgi:hypothetical protein
VKPLFGRRRRTSEHKADVSSRQLLPDRKPQDFLIWSGEPLEDVDYLSISFATNNDHVNSVFRSFADDAQLRHKSLRPPGGTTTILDQAKGDAVQPRKRRFRIKPIHPAPQHGEYLVRDVLCF